MAETIRCPDCDRTVSVPERLFGKRVRCPSCKAIFTAESPVVDVEVLEDEAPPRPPARKPARRDHDEDKEEAPRRKRPVEEEEEATARSRRRKEEREEEPGRRVRPKAEDEDKDAERPRGRHRPADEDEEDEEESRPQRKRPKLTGDMVWGWKRVRAGLLFVLAAAVVAVLANIGGVLGFRALDDADVVVPSRTGPSLTTGIILLLVFYYLAIAVAVGLAMTGNIICMAIPEPKTARSTLTSSLAMMAVGLFLFLGGVIYLWVRVAIWKSKIPLLAPADVPRPPAEGLVVYIFGATLLLAQPGVFSLFVRNAAQGVRQSGLAISLIFQAIAPALIALAFAIAAMSMYSALTGDAVNREAGDAGWTTVKTLYFVEFAYAAWFITSLILTHLAITRHIERR